MPEPGDFLHNTPVRLVPADTTEDGPIGHVRYANAAGVLLTVTGLAGQPFPMAPHDEFWPWGSVKLLVIQETADAR